MPVTPTYPGVYIEEIPSGVRTITGVATSITAFIGRALRGPTNEPKTINSFGDFERTFGGLWQKSTLGFAVRDFYLNGGSQAIIVRLYHPSLSDEQRDKALRAAQAVADEVTNAAKDAQTDQAVTVASVVDAAMKKSKEYEKDVKATEVEKSAANFVAKAASNAPPGTTSECVKDATRKKTDDFVGLTTFDVAMRVANAARDQAAKTGANPDDVAKAAYDEAKKAAEENDSAKDAANEVAKAAETAAKKSGATTVTVKEAALNESNDAENALEPRKSAAHRVAKAAEEAAAQQGATAETVKDAAQKAAKMVADEAEAKRNAADEVAMAAKLESAKNVQSIKNTADAAVLDAAPLPKARLAIDNLNFEAVNEGSWGNELRVRVDYEVRQEMPESYKAYGLSKDDLFNLTIRDGMTGVTEVFRNVTVKDSPRKVDEVLKNESYLVRVRGDIVPTRPVKSNDATKDQKIWEDNNPTTNYKVTERASDGTSLVINDFTGEGMDTGKKGLYALEKTDLFNLLCIPPYNATATGLDVDTSLIADAAAYCEKRRAILIVDSPSNWREKGTAKNKFNDQNTDHVGTRSKNAALFFPRVKQPNPLKDNQVEEFVPCGAVAGVFARTDVQRGVWKAPAGNEAVLVGVPEFSVSLTDSENGELNPIGINCLRVRPAAGRVIWGSRTLQGDDRLASEWKYIPVRRLALYIEESLYRGTQWVVFEPNDEPLWSQIRLNIGAFMHNLFRQGAFKGQTPREAYFVKCDKETTTQNDINLGIVNILVGFAPLKPAEFVIIKIQQMAGQIQT